jgi:succinyl-CoA synthetase beta subunit
MKIHEYQARELMNEFGIRTNEGQVVSTPEAAAEVARQIGGTVVIKAQVLVGGRGKAGGVKLAKSPEEAEEKARHILGLSIKGLPVEKVLVVRAADILNEYYVGITLDRAAKRNVLIVSAAGGVEIEELAVQEPEKILNLPIDPLQGLDERRLASFLKEAFREEWAVEQATETARKLYRLYQEKDCSLVEINPYAQVAERELMAIDAKINFDDNALFRHQDVEEMRNAEEYAPGELDAREAGLSFVSLDGEIGCIVNGAGLAMATMDIIKLFGGQPANFLDVGGSSNPNKVLAALKIILQNPKLKAILINIFGGITRCDDIANGILMARQQLEIPVPMVVRLVGTNEEEGRKILLQAGLQASEQLTDAVKKVVAAAEEKVG